MSAKTWRLVDALEWGSRRLGGYGIEVPRLESQLLLGHVLDRGQTYLYLNSEELLSESSLSSFLNLIEQRKKRVPWQYLTGRGEFMSLDFVVNEAVMIPRPETEILVEAALNKVKSSKFEVKSCCAIKDQRSASESHLFTIIDMGTGCGNIAVTLAKALPCRVYALDVSEAALRVAGVNAERLGVSESITFLREDIFALKGLDRLEGKASLVISNPPYITTAELARLQPEVSCFEPREALDGGEDGLEFYPPLIDGAAVCLRQGGWLALEVGIGQAEAVRDLIVETSRFSCPEIIKDYSRIERVIVSRKQ